MRAEQALRAYNYPTLVGYAPNARAHSAAYRYQIRSCAKPDKSREPLLCTSLIIMIDLIIIVITMTIMREF